ncbi:MAG: GNAT family N-acetyltransferase [Microbacteriaceae bacterium]
MDLEYATVDGRSLDLARVLDLYGAVGWTSYSNDPGTLSLALAGSTTVVVARRGDVIVGLARVISDRASICYLQDVLVLPSEQRAGVGRALVELALAPYAHVRQKVVLTDDEAAQQEFYESLGYSLVEGSLRAFVRFD